MTENEDSHPLNNLIISPVVVVVVVVIVVVVVVVVLEQKFAHPSVHAKRLSMYMYIH